MAAHSSLEGTSAMAWVRARLADEDTRRWGAGYLRLVALVFAFACITFQGVFLYHAGLSNLRMDLSQALAYGAAVTLLAVARHTGRVRDWLLFGTMLGVALLFRATTPVY